MQYNSAFMHASPSRQTVGSLLMFTSFLALWSRFLSWIGERFATTAASATECVVIERGVETPVEEPYVLSIKKGTAAYISENFSDAIVHFTSACERSPDAAEALYFRGLALSAIGNYEAAIDDFTAALRMAPSNRMIYHSRASARAKQGDMAGALEDLHNATRLDSNELS